MGERAAQAAAAPVVANPIPGAAPMAAHGPVQQKPDGGAPAASNLPPGPGPFRAPVIAAADADAETPAAGPPIQRAPNSKDWVPIQIRIDHEVDADEFSILADAQVFGRRVPGDYQGLKGRYSPADSPITVYYSLSMIQRYRGRANAASGIATDAQGGVVGADVRATEFGAQTAGGEKTALIAEIDRRYAAATGTGDKIKPGEPAKSKLWIQIRDEVLFQQEHLRNLPDSAKAIIKQSTNGKQLEPSDYDQLFRIAKKIENLPPGAAADYASKITGTAKDLSAFETAVDTYTADLANRNQQDAERTATMNKLVGLEEIYKLYRQYKAQAVFEAVTPGGALVTVAGELISGKPVPGSSSALRQQLERDLPRYGFGGIAEFEHYIARFQQQFEDSAVTIVMELLQKYAGKLYKEQQRYTDPAVIKTLHGKLTGFRAQYQEVQKQNAIIGAEATKRVRGSAPGGGYSPPKSQAQVDAEARGTAALEGAKQNIKDLSGEYPIFAEDDLPTDKRLNKEALGRADESQLGGVLLAHIAERQEVVTDAKGRISDKHELIYKLDKLMPSFYAAMDIQQGSIHDLIIQDKMKEDAIKKIVVGVVLAIVAIALTVVSLGSATPAIVAAGASIGAAGLSTYMAYDEYKEYTENQALADAGYADDPTVVWLVLAIVGAGIEMGSAVKAVRALAPAAKALEAGGDLAEFTKAVEALKKTKELDAKIAAAAERAGNARRAYAAAKGELKSALGSKLYSFPGPLLDPDVYKAVVKMAVAKIQQGSHSLGQFIDELRQARLAAKLGDLTPEELVKAKQAWAAAEHEAKLAEDLVKRVPDATLLGKLTNAVKDPATLHRLLDAFPPAELEKIVTGVKNPEQLLLLIDHMGNDSGVALIRKWADKGRFDLLENFARRMGEGEKVLGETSKLTKDSLIIDSNLAIALTNDAEGVANSPANVARVAHIKSLPSGTELRVGSVTVGEVNSGKVVMHGGIKGMPIAVLRESPEYEKVLNQIKAFDAGGKGAIQDPMIIADTFFARTDGAVPRFLTGDSNIYNKLARAAGFDPAKMGASLPDLATAGKLPAADGFLVTIEGRTIKVLPIK